MSSPVPCVGCISPTWAPTSSRSEEPGAGDASRRTYDAASVPGGDSSVFLAIATNRNKRSIALDLSRAEGRALFLDLVKHADVVIEAYRGGVAERLGIGYEPCAAVNPRLVERSLSDWTHGPRSREAGARYARPRLSPLAGPCRMVGAVTDPTPCAGSWRRSGSPPSRRRGGPGPPPDLPRAIAPPAPPGPSACPSRGRRAGRSLRPPMPRGGRCRAGGGGATVWVRAAKPKWAMRGQGDDEKVSLAFPTFPWDHAPSLDLYCASST